VRAPRVRLHHLLVAQAHGQRRAVDFFSGPHGDGPCLERNQAAREVSAIELLSIGLECPVTIFKAL
jgi:hypothetical protein